MQCAFAAAILLYALDYLVALLPEPVHFHYLFGRMLKVAVDYNAAVAGGLFKPCEHGGLLTEIAAEVHADHIDVFLRSGAYLAPGAVF